MAVSTEDQNVGFLTPADLETSAGTKAIFSGIQHPQIPPIFDFLLESIVLNEKFP